MYKAGTREAALRDLAETSSCRRQVLLDALGAEQSVCSGCDICNGIKYDLCDWELAHKLIKKSRNFFSKDEIQEELTQRMNLHFRKVLGVNVWEHNDSVEVVDQLMKKGLVRVDRFLWRNKLYVQRTKRTAQKIKQGTNP